MLVSLLSICFMLSLSTSAAAAPRLVQGVRSGWHGTFARIVFDVQGDISYHIAPTAESSKIVVTFPDVSEPPGAKVWRARTPMIEDIRFVAAQGQVSAEITLKRSGTVRTHYRMRSPTRIVVDIVIPADGAPDQRGPAGQPPGKEAERVASAASARRQPQTATPPATPPEEKEKRPAPETKVSPMAPEQKEPPLAQEGKGQLPPQHTARPVTPPKLPGAGPLTAMLSETELLAVAERQWQQGQLPAAQESYRQFLQRFPEYPHNHLISVRLADILQKQQQYRPALEAYARVLALYPGSEGALISEMRMAELGIQVPDLSPQHEAVRFKAYHAPVESLRRLIREYPLSPLADVARFKIGVLQLQRQEAAAALTEFRELLNTPLKEDLRQEVRAKYRQALLSVMAELQEQGQHPEVLRTFFTHKGVLSPQEAESADFLLPVALSYARLGLLPEAQSLFQAQMRAAATPQHRGPIALEQANVLMAGGLLQDAYTLLKSTAPHAEGATRGQILVTLGKLALRLGQAGEAVQYLRKGQEVITSAAERATLFALLGEAYAAQGRDKEGLQAFQQCAESATAAESAPLPSAETCLFRAAEFLFAQRQYQPALALYQKLLETFPHTSYRDWALLRLAAISQGLSDTAQMQNTLETLRDTAASTLWQKVAMNALEEAAWQRQFRERLAEFQNRLMR